jgi:hypothetical protein
MTLPGYVPPSGERDLDKIVRSIRNLYENAAGSNDASSTFVGLLASVADLETRVSSLEDNPSSAAGSLIHKLGSLTPHENLTVKTAASATVGITADALVLFDSGGVAKRFTGLSETLNIANSGVNGLDSGSESASTWYHVFPIGKTDGTVDAILSANSTTPTLPSGYDYYGYGGAVYNDGSSHLTPFYQRNLDVVRQAVNVLSSGSATAITSVSLVSGVPPTATAAAVRVVPFLSSGGPNEAQVSLQPSSTGFGGVTFSLPDQTTAAARFELLCMMETPQVIWYLVAGTNARTNLVISGFSYK